MDIIQIILGRYLIEFFGAFIRYIYEKVKALISNKEQILFSDFWNPKGSEDKKMEVETSNRIVGLIFFVIFFLILISITI